MANQRLRRIAITVLLVLVVGVSFARSGVLQKKTSIAGGMPARGAPLERFGVRFHRVPTKPQLSVSWFLLEMENQDQRWYKPTLLVRNEGPSCRIADISVRGRRGDDVVRYQFGSLATRSPDQWGRHQYPGDDVVLEARSWLMITSNAPLPASLPELKPAVQQPGPPSSRIDLVAPALHFTVHSHDVVVHDDDGPIVSGRRRGLMPLFFAG